MRHGGLGGYRVRQEQSRCFYEVRWWLWLWPRPASAILIVTCPSLPVGGFVVLTQLWCGLGRSGLSALQTACSYGQIDVARLLLERSAEQSIKGQCLLQAVESRQVEMARALLTWQADFPFAEQDARCTATAKAIERCCPSRYRWRYDHGGEDDEVIAVDDKCYGLVKLLLQERRGETR